MSREIDYRVGDPVMDAAQGRPMQVVNVPGQTVAEWSDAEGYDLLDNYANAKFDPDPAEPVVECVYVSDVRSEPSKTYTFPVSRVRLLDVHHADGGRRIYDRVAVDVLEAVFRAAFARGLQGRGSGEEAEWLYHEVLSDSDVFDGEVVDLAWELADVERTIGGSDDE